MKYSILLMFVLSLICGFSACEDKTAVTVDELEGSWIVSEVGGSFDGMSYEVEIKKDMNNNGFVLVTNFLNTANDPSSMILNYSLRVKVEGSRLVILPQQVGDVEIRQSTGLVNDINQFRINYEYTDALKAFSATAYFVRK